MENTQVQEKKILRPLKDKQKTYYIETYGCQMNVYDSEKIVDALKIIGYEKTEDLKGADCFILNTCHIRDRAKEKVYHEIEIFASSACRTYRTLPRKLKSGEHTIH